MASTKNIVIVGYSLAGGHVYNSIKSKLPADARIIIVTERSYAYSSIASLRGAVVPGWENQMVIPISQATQKGTTVIQARAVSFNSSTITLDRSVEEFGTEIPFAVLVVATGSHYSIPCRPSENADTLEEARSSLKELQQSIGKGKEFLIIGGGPVGVEFAGEIKDRYPEKKVTIVDSHAHLVSTMPAKLGENLQSQLKDIGVTVLLKQKVDVGDKLGLLEATEIFTTSTGTAISADYIINARGTKPNVELIKNSDAAAITERGARVKPNFLLDSAVNANNNIFVLGDAADTVDLKTAMAVGKQAPTVGKNVLTVLSNPKAANLKENGAVASPMMLIPIGQSRGAAYLFGFTLGSWFAKRVKGQNLLLNMAFYPVYSYKP